MIGITAWNVPKNAAILIAFAVLNFVVSPFAIETEKESIASAVAISSVVMYIWWSFFG
jgi:hypothetical protein